MSGHPSNFWPPDEPRPEGLHWPPRFFWSHGELQVWIPRSSVHTVATGAVVLTKLYRDSRGTTYGQLWFSLDDAWQSVVVPLDTLTATEGVQQLVRYGVPVLSPRYLREFLWAYYALNHDKLPVAWTPDQGGWWDHPERYVWGAGVWHEGRLSQRDVFVLDPQFRQWQTLQAVDHDPAVTEAEWNWWRRVVLKHAPQMALGLAAIGASLLLHRYQRSNFVLHIGDTTSTGKTTTLMLLASMLGDPHETTGLVRKWQAQTDLPPWTGWMKDSVWFLDDATRVPSGDLADALYWMVSGNPPNTGLATRGIGLSTSERPFPKVVEGVSARVLEWTQSWLPLGVPVDAWTARILDPTRWGWALPLLMEAFAAHNPRTIHRWLRRQRSGADGITQRWQTYWNTLAAGASLWPDPRIRKQVQEEEEKWWAQQPTPAP